MSEERPETRSSYNFSIRSEKTVVKPLTEKQKLFKYMDDVFDKISKSRDLSKSSLIVVSKKDKYIKTNMEEDSAKFSYASIASFSDKVQYVVNKLLPGENVELIRLKGSKDSEIFVTFDDRLEIIVLDNYNRGKDE